MTGVFAGGIGEEGGTEAEVERLHLDAFAVDGLHGGNFETCWTDAEQLHVGVPPRATSMTSQSASRVRDARGGHGEGPSKGPFEWSSWNFAWWR